MKYFNADKKFYKDKDVKDGYIHGGKDSFPIIKYKSFKKLNWMDACFSTRYGGVSKGYLESMNLGFDVGDGIENVKKNYHLISERIGVEVKNIALTDQVHQDKILYADKSLCIGEDLTKKTKDCDGLYTKERDIVLTAGFADCVPVYLADTRTMKIALVHSGWKGTVKKIGAKAVGLLKEMGSDPRDIVAVIGPSISYNNYEVTGEVIEEFNKVFEKECMEDIAVKTDDIHYHLDLWAACFYYLKAAGLKADNIHFSGICTYDNFTELFSHRRSNGKRGNMKAFMWIPSSFPKRNNKKEDAIKDVSGYELAMAISDYMKR